MSLSTYIALDAQRCHIIERLRISSNTKSIKFYKPKSKEELRSIIERELENQGVDADLSHIDTSEITDMEGLFRDLNVRNIKIDQWDISNVKTTFNMFKAVLILTATYQIGMFHVLDI